MNLILPINILQEIIQEKEIGIAEAIIEHKRHIQLREEKIKELRNGQTDDIRSLKEALYQLQISNTACLKCGGTGIIKAIMSPIVFNETYKCKICSGTGKIVSLREMRSPIKGKFES